MIYILVGICILLCIGPIVAVAISGISFISKIIFTLIWMFYAAPKFTETLIGKIKVRGRNEI